MTIESYILKAANQIKNNDATLADDSELVLTLNANTTYLISARVMFYSPLTPAFKYQFAFTGTVTDAVGWLQHQAPNPLSVSGMSQKLCTIFEAASLGATTYSIAGSSNAAYRGPVRLRLRLNVGASGGTFSFKWAQNVLTVADTTVYAGSYLIAEVPE